MTADTSFDVIVGLDQTGASRKRGLASAPLPAVVLERREEAWVVTRIGDLPALTPDALEAFGVAVDGRLAIAVDACLGLPADAVPSGTTFWDWCDAAADFSVNGRRYGRDVAEAYFRDLVPTAGGARRVDHEVGALSVLKNKPFQRNVQTGSYRVWRDLGEAKCAHGRWVVRWPDARDPCLPLLCEVYPSWGWRTLFQLRSRQPGALPALVEGHADVSTEVPLEQLVTSPDHADAMVAAWLGVQHLVWQPTRPPHDIDRREGWILGVT